MAEAAEGSARDAGGDAELEHTGRQDEQTPRAPEASIRWSTPLERVRQLLRELEQLAGEDDDAASASER